MGFSSQAWVDLREVDGKLTAHAWNKAFIADLRKSLEEELVRQGTYKTDQEVVDLWLARRNHESEKPVLNVVHTSINKDGTLNLRLEWNDAFIKMLRDNGFDAEDEDTLVQSYLASIARENAGVDLPAQQQQAMDDDAPAMMQNIITHAAATDVNALLDDLPSDIVKDLERELRRRAQMRGGRKVIKK